MVLHESMIAHELDCAIALARVILCRIPLPHTYGRQLVNDDAV
jgi:hypothetical protein